MVNKCRIPKEVIERFKSGAKEVEDCGPQWNENAKFVERKGKKVCAKYHREDIPEECFK